MANNPFSDIYSQYKNKNGEAFSNNTNKDKTVSEQREKLNNTVHQDYGRYIPMARKEKGFTFANFNVKQLNSVESLSKVNKKTILGKDDPQLYQSKGYSPFAYHFMKGILNGLPVNPVFQTDLFVFTGNALADSQIKTYIYAKYISQFKELFEKHVLSFNNDLGNKETQDNMIEFLSKMVKEINLRHPFGVVKNVNGVYENIFPANSPDNDNDLKNEIIKTFPEYKDKLEALSGNYFHVFAYRMMLRSNNIINMFSSDTYSSKMALSKAVKTAETRYRKQSTWDSIVGIEVKQPENIEEAKDLNDLLDKYLSVKIKTSFNKMIAVKAQNTLEQEHFDEIVRNGFDYVGNKVLTAEDLDKEFGINGIQWGKWVNSKNERQNIINLVYESFNDLCEVLNIEKKSISLKDKESLALGFGSQGLAHTKGHYNDSFKFLHLTKLNGAGSLAHEWFHAYDNYLFNDCLAKGLISEQYQNAGYLSRLVQVLNKTEQHEELEKIASYNSDFVDLIQSCLQKQYVSFNKDSDNVLALEYAQNRRNFIDTYDLQSEFLNVYKMSFMESKAKIKQLRFVLTTLDTNDEKDKKWIVQNAKQLNVLFNAFLPEDSQYRNPMDIDDGSGIKCNFYFQNIEEIKKELEQSISQEYSILLDKDVMNNDYTTFFNLIEEHMVGLEKSIYQDNEEINHFIKSVKDEELVQNVDKKNLVKFEQHKVFEKSQDFFFGFAEYKDKTGLDKIVSSGTYDKDNENSLLSKIEKSDISPFVKKHLITQLHASFFKVNSVLMTQVYQGVKHRLMMEMLDLGYTFEMNQESQIYKSSYEFDKKMGKVYYSTIEEMFARIGETVISKNSINNYLSKTKSTLDQIPVYPVGNELDMFEKKIKSAMKKSFPNDFEVKLEDLPYLHNQYGKNEKMKML